MPVNFREIPSHPDFQTQVQHRAGQNLGDSIDQLELPGDYPFPIAAGAAERSGDLQESMLAMQCAHIIERQYAVIRKPAAGLDRLALQRQRREETCPLPKKAVQRYVLGEAELVVGGTGQPGRNASVLQRVTAFDGDAKSPDEPGFTRVQLGRQCGFVPGGALHLLGSDDGFGGAHIRRGC